MYSYSKVCGIEHTKSDGVTYFIPVLNSNDFKFVGDETKMYCSITVCVRY